MDARAVADSSSGSEATEEPTEPTELSADPTSGRDDESDQGSAEPAAERAAAADTGSGTAPVPEQRAAAEAEPDPERGKSRRPRKAVRNKTAGGTKALVVWREGKVQYADDSVLVIDLDEAAAADTDVHDVVDRLTELREALDSPGRSDAVAVLAEIIQEKALN